MADTTPPLDYQEMVRANFPWNFSVNVIDITFITLGLSLVSRETVMPLLVSQLTDSRIAIGLIPAIYSLGFLLPQLFTASYAERLRRSKPFVILVGGLGERVPYLLIGLALWSLAASNPTAALWAFFLCLATTALSNGVATPAWFNMVAKVIPTQRRGLFFGLSASLGALMGIAGAALVGRILEDRVFPENFAWLFILASLAVGISWIGLALNREPDSPVVKERVPMITYLRQLPAVLRRDRNYVRYLLSFGALRLGTMASGFYLVYGAERFELGGAEVGLFTGLLIGSQAAMNLLWGVVGDRRGHKTVLAGAGFILTLAALVAWLAPSAAWLGLTFVLLGAAMAGDRVSNMNIILEFCAPEDRPTYIGLTNTLLAPVVTLAPLIGGWLATAAGYPGLFVVTTLVAGLGGLLLARWVREPRYTKESPQATGAAPSAG